MIVIWVILGNGGNEVQENRWQWRSGIRSLMPYLLVINLSYLSLDNYLSVELYYFSSFIYT